MAAVVYVLSTLLHEGGGHGLACLAVGGHATTWGAFYFDCDTRGLPAAAGRLMAAAGNTVNLLVALACRAAWLRASSAGARVLLWLAFTVNAYVWAGYFLFSGLTGIGDWGTTAPAVLAGVPHVLLWRVALVVVGALFYYWWTTTRSARMLGAMFGGTPESVRTGSRVSITAYVIGGVVSVLVGLLNPVGLFITLASAAAASLGGTIGLLFVALAIPRNDRPGDTILTRSPAWIAGGVAAAVLYAVVFGRSITLGA